MITELYKVVAAMWVNMFTVYILYSNTTQKYYTGQTQDFENRIKEHNAN
jgi:predicted GIY-YIG superfamily endonuclease